MKEEVELGPCRSRYARAKCFGVKVRVSEEIRRIKGPLERGHVKQTATCSLKADR